MPMQPREGEPSRLDKFSPGVRHVFDLAVREARMLNHDYIGTEHLLLGLAQQEGSFAMVFLTRFGVGINNLRRSVDFIIGKGDKPSPETLSFTPRAKRAMDTAIYEAGKFGSPVVYSEHLLLGIVRYDDSIASGVLESLSVNSKKAEQEIVAFCESTPNRKSEQVFARLQTLLKQGNLSNEDKIKLITRLEELVTLAEFGEF